MKSPVPQSNRRSSSKESIVFVVDDDPIVRGAIGNLLLSVGQQVQQYGSATELLQRSLPEAASCLILDIRLPGLGGLDLQVELAKADVPIPIIFITGHGDIPMSVKAMKEGAVDFLTKPFRDQDLLDAVARALERDRERRDDAKDSIFLITLPRWILAVSTLIPILPAICLFRSPSVTRAMVCFFSR
jgi:FixJ family two-component response regulator